MLHNTLFLTVYKELEGFGTQFTGGGDTDNMKEVKVIGQLDHRLYSSYRDG